MGVSRADKRRVDEMRVKVGVKDSFKKKLVRSRLTRAGHVERMGDEKLTKRTDAQKMDGTEVRKIEIAKGIVLMRRRKSGRRMQKKSSR